MNNFRKLSLTTQLNWIVILLGYTNFLIITRLIGNYITLALMVVLPAISSVLAIYNIFKNKESKQNIVILVLSILPYLYYIAVFIAYWRASNT